MEKNTALLITRQYSTEVGLTNFVVLIKNKLYMSRCYIGDLGRV